MKSGCLPQFDPARFFPMALRQMPNALALILCALIVVEPVLAADERYQQLDSRCDQFPSPSYCA
jgi:hypothetical protein